jgi:hypothetical protein
MAASPMYPQELREWARRLVSEAAQEDPGLSVNGTAKRVGDASA